MGDNLAPIALFVYNRPLHTRRTIEALRNNELASLSDLYIFSDGSKNSDAKIHVDEVRTLVNSLQGFKTITVVERERNYGLADSIIDGVTRLCNEFGRVVVLEDDLETSPYFLTYMRDALDLYEDEDEVISIHGYMYPIKGGLPETFFMRGADCWGWATWKDKWASFETDGALLLRELKRRNLTKRFDLNGSYPFTQMLVDQVAGNNDSWAVRWYASAFLSEKLTLYPGSSLVLNIGNDGSGTHCGETNVFSVQIASAAVAVSPIKVVENELALELVKSYFRRQRKGLMRRVKMLCTNAWRKLSL